MGAGSAMPARAYRARFVPLRQAPAHCPSTDSPDARPGSRDAMASPSLEVPQPSEPATPAVPSAPVTPADPDPGSPAAPEEPARVPAPEEPATPIDPDPGPEPRPRPDEGSR